MSKTLMHAIPFIEARHTGRKQRPKTILLRLSETTSRSGAALGVANYWHASNAPLESCHYVVDEELTFQCVPDDRVALCSRHNTKGIISINVCALPTFSVEDFQNGLYAPVLDNAAKLTAQLASEHNIPVRYVDLLEHRRIFTRGGVMVSVRGAWPTHTFLDLVKNHKS